MKIVIINGNPSQRDSSFDARLKVLRELMASRRHTVEEFTLRELKIGQCIGCFDCWLKTPGVCPLKDDHAPILSSFVVADLVLMASPLIMGFTSALLKRTCDRLVPTLLPFIDGKSGECRHYLRYGRAPALGLLYAPEGDTDDEDVTIVATLWRRMARNTGSRFALIRSIEDPAEEIFHEIDHH